MDVIHPDDREKSSRAWAAAVAIKGEYKVEHRLRRVDGVYRHMTVRAVPVLEADGSVREWVGVHADVTDQHRAEADLRLRDRAIGAASQGIVIADYDRPDHPLIYVSPGFERMTGYDSGEVLGRNCRFLQGKDTDPAAVAELRQAVRDGLACEVELLNYRKDGTPFWTALSISPVHDSARRVTHFVGVQQDVTERKRAEATLRENEERIRVLMDSAVEAIYGVDLAGHCTFCNLSCASMLAYASPSCLIGKNMHALMHHTRVDGTPYPVEECRIYVAIRQGLGSHVVDEVLWRADGTCFPAEYWSNPIFRAGQVVGAVVSFQDITARKSLEEQFRQAQKMDAFGQLAGGVAHDFNNLLTVINGYSELLLGSLPRNDPSREMIAEVHKAGERSAGLTRQLLAFSRQQVLAPRILNLNEVVAETDKMLRRLIGEDIRLTSTLESHPWAVEADPGQIEQVMLNLAVNARDAMPRGGRLTIETRNVTLDEAYARTHTGARAGRHVLLSVSDSGEGIPPGILAKIFEPYFTTKEPGKGTGLGLATVFGIVEQSGGHVAVDSEVGAGTTFKVYLPQVEQASEGSKAPSPIPPPPRGTETILLAEDEPAVRMLTRRILTGRGYRVLEAADGEEAVRVAAGHAGPIHLLITDVVMPGMGGRAAAEALAERQPGIRVVYLSGYTDDAVIRHGVLREGVHFLHKPFTAHELARKVRDVLDSPAETGGP